uniref:AlNc14C240G9452 protein n=1 Tax=Albugo laibachii Nc14 TaxID=890382 RepID=F0WSW1_9STRA|nr:AlNc14C240G9452 [Albugo laibachii Nc14]CCA25111.1 AlNc14C276G10038 [Albugo laibachii Nc14]|eukprot:CCA25111.1 AlNc14C276G10038 [Albugo laibachii Nc14]
MAGEERKSVKGQRRKPKQFKDDGHSFELNLAVLKTLDTATMNETIGKFFPALPAANVKRSATTLSAGVINELRLSAWQRTSGRRTTSASGKKAERHHQVWKVSARSLLG